MPDGDDPNWMTGRLLVVDDVVVEEIHDELCLLRLDTSDVLVLNRTAADVWLLITETTDLETITQDLARAYGVEVRAIADDVSAMVGLMVTRGFVRVQAESRLEDQ